MWGVADHPMSTRAAHGLILGRRLSRAVGSRPRVLRARFLVIYVIHSHLIGQDNLPGIIRKVSGHSRELCSSEQLAMARQTLKAGKRTHAFNRRRSAACRDCNEIDERRGEALRPRLGDHWDPERPMDDARGTRLTRDYNSPNLEVVPALDYETSDWSLATSPKEIWGWRGRSRRHNQALGYLGRNPISKSRALSERAASNRLVSKHRPSVPLKGCDSLLVVEDEKVVLQHCSRVASPQRFIGAGRLGMQS